MQGEAYNYTVFKRDEKSPTGYEMVVFNSPTGECAKAMNIAPETFQRYKSEMKRGTLEKWMIFRSLASGNKIKKPKIYAKCHVLKDIDFDIIKNLHKGKTKKEIAERNWMTVQAIEYHFKKIKRLTGLDVLDESDLEKLYKKYVEEKNERT